jgi:hypothetical protein
MFHKFIVIYSFSQAYLIGIFDLRRQGNCYETWESLKSASEISGLLECDAVLFGECNLMFWRNKLHSF